LYEAINEGDKEVFPIGEAFKGAVVFLMMIAGARDFCIDAIDGNKIQERLPRL
jgi:hypothetical protein